jgi:hypothetical protein
MKKESWIRIYCDEQLQVLHGNYQEAANKEVFIG